MKNRYKLLTTFISLFLLVFSFAGVNADTIILKNGNEINGIITKKGKDYVVEFSTGTMTVPEEEVERVKKSTSNLQVFRDRHEQIQSSDADAHYELGRWADARGLNKQAKREFKHAIQRNPDHKKARKALGFTQYNGQWMTEEEKMRKKGYVKYNGEWMTPDVKQKRLEIAERRKERTQKIRDLKRELEESRQEISDLKDQVRDLRNDLRVAQIEQPRYRYYPIFTNRRRNHRKRDPHKKLWTRKDNGNTVIIDHTSGGEVWKEVTSSGSKKVIHKPGDGHSVKKSGDHSRLLQTHQDGGKTDIELVHPRHHHD